MELAFHGKTLPSCLGFRDRPVYRRVQCCGLQNMQQFSVLSDAEIDERVVEYLSRRGLTTGRTYLAGDLSHSDYEYKEEGLQKFHWGELLIYCFVMGNFYCSKTVFCTLAKFLMAFGWPPLSYALGSWVH